MKTSELAARIGATCEGGDVEVNSVTSYALATSQSLVFVEQERYLEAALASQAGAVIVPAVVTAESAPGKVLLRAQHPRLAFARAYEELARGEAWIGGIDPSAVVDPRSSIHPTARVDELAVIGPDVSIGAHTRIGPGCVIGDGVDIGEDCQLVARVTVYPGTTIGNRVIVHAGSVLGSDGFGFVPDPQTGRYHKFPQIGRLEIGNDVELGANVTIDRGALESTIISDGVKLDNMVHVGHNARLGKNVVIAAQTGVSGSSVLEDSVLVGGQVGIADHVYIESGVILGAQAGIPSKKVIRGKGVVFWGTPARPIGECLKEMATVSRLARKKK